MFDCCFRRPREEGVVLGERVNGGPPGVTPVSQESRVAVLTEEAPPALGRQPQGETNLPNSVPESSAAAVTASASLERAAEAVATGTVVRAPNCFLSFFSSLGAVNKSFGVNDTDKEFLTWPQTFLF